MKRIFILFFIPLVLSFVSCKKSYRCTCKSVFSGGDYTSVAIANSSKSDAKAWCDAIQKSQVQPGVTTTCVLN
jgi:hypothetical protein